MNREQTDGHKQQEPTKIMNAKPKQENAKNTFAYSHQFRPGNYVGRDINNRLWRRLQNNMSNPTWAKQ